jgi:Flp pilus assembly pilin Flp
MSKLFQQFGAQDEGQDIVEYVLLMAMVALAAAASFPGLSGTLVGALNTVITMLESV